MGNRLRQAQTDSIFLIGIKVGYATQTIKPAIVALSLSK